MVDSYGLPNIPEATLIGMVDGQTQIAREHTIMYAVKGNKLLLVPVRTDYENILIEPEHVFNRTSVRTNSLRQKTDV